jgi:hypothetical protein
VSSSAHISHAPSASAAHWRLQRYGGVTFFYFLLTSHLVHRNISRRARSGAGLESGRHTALNPYKQAIFTHERVIERPLVQYGICATFYTPNNEFLKRLIMKTNLKVVLSAVALAALVAAPAVAKSRTQTAPAPAYSNNDVIQDGRVLGTDPDPRIRAELRRDGNSFLND